MAQTKRSKIVDGVFQRILSLENESFKWKTKVKAPLLTVASVYSPAFSVFDFQEQVMGTTPPTGHGVVKANLNILIEFWVAQAYDENASEKLNEVLGRIQMALGVDFVLGGLVQGLTELGSKLKVEVDKQKVVTGEVVYVASYIRDAKDPFKSP